MVFKMNLVIMEDKRDRYGAENTTTYSQQQRRLEEIFFFFQKNLDDDGCPYFHIIRKL